MTYMTLVN